MRRRVKNLQRIGNIGTRSGLRSPYSPRLSRDSGARRRAADGSPYLRLLICPRRHGLAMIPRSERPNSLRESKSRTGHESADEYGVSRETIGRTPRQGGSVAAGSGRPLPMPKLRLAVRRVQKRGPLSKHLSSLQDHSVLSALSLEPFRWECQVAELASGTSFRSDNGSMWRLFQWSSMGRSLSSRSKLCQASIQRMEPERERMARDCVCAPPLK